MAPLSVRFTAHLYLACATRWFVLFSRTSAAFLASLCRFFHAISANTAGIYMAYGDST
jgi:hypothetical protein